PTSSARSSCSAPLPITLTWTAKISARGALQTFLQLGLILRHVLARIAIRERCNQLADQPVAFELDLDRHARPRTLVERLDRDCTDGSHWTAGAAERGAARRVVLRDLVRDGLLAH